MTKKSTVPDAWDDDWEATADTSASSSAQPAEEYTQKKVSSRATKAQRRAQQAEFNRQLWQQAEGPRETFHFLETRPGAAVPLKQEFKPPPILLSRKGPVIQQPQRPGNSSLTQGVNDLSLRNDKDGSSSDDETSTAPTLTLEERKAKAAREREEKQRKYEERREQLFGPANAHPGSGTSSPSDLTPPSSRSGTPSRGRGGGAGGRGRGNGTNQSGGRSSSGRRDVPAKKDLFDPTYSPKPDSSFLLRREATAGSSSARDQSAEGLMPVRAPRGPDGSGRGGAGFAARGGKATTT